MKNQYFTPDIGDIRVGYECEIGIHGWFDADNIQRNEGEGDALVKRTSWFPWIFRSVVPFLEVEDFRVPYLTKEQIEAEGWAQLEDKSPFTSKPYKWRKVIGMKETGVFNEDHIYTLEFYGNGNTSLTIHLEWESSWNRFEGNIFVGRCRDINTFRYICKLLNI